MMVFGHDIEETSINRAYAKMTHGKSDSVRRSGTSIFVHPSQVPLPRLAFSGCVHVSREVALRRPTRVARSFGSAGARTDLSHIIFG